MKKLIIVMAILLISCVEKRVESTNWVDIGGKPDVTIHKVGNHQVLTFTFEQDGHKYMVGIYNQGGIDMVEIHEQVNIQPTMKMFELIPYMLELDYDSEIRIIEDLEHDDGELPRLMDVVPSIMLNTITGKKTFALIKKEAMDRYIANNNTVTRLKPSDKIS